MPRPPRLTSDSSPPPAVQHLRPLLPRGPHLEFIHNPQPLSARSPATGAAGRYCISMAPGPACALRKGRSLTRASELRKWGGLNRTMCEKPRPGSALPVQWLGLNTSTAKGPGSILGRGSKILQVSRCGQKNLKEKLLHLFTKGFPLPILATSHLCRGSEYCRMHPHSHSYTMAASQIYYDPLFLWVAGHPQNPNTALRLACGNSMELTLACSRQ